MEMLISRGIGVRSQRAKRQVFLFIQKVNVFFFHHGDIPQNFEFGLGSTGSVSRFLRLLFKLTSF